MPGNGTDKKDQRQNMMSQKETISIRYIAKREMSIMTITCIKYQPSRCFLPNHPKDHVQHKIVHHRHVPDVLPMHCPPFPTSIFPQSLSPPTQNAQPLSFPTAQPRCTLSLSLCLSLSHTPFSVTFSQRDTLFLYNRLANNEPSLDGPQDPSQTPPFLIYFVNCVFHSRPEYGKKQTGRQRDGDVDR